MTGVSGYPDRSAILLKPVVLNVLNTAAPGAHCAINSTITLQNGNSRSPISCVPWVPRSNREITLTCRADEVACLLSGEIIFKLGDEVTAGDFGSFAFLPHSVPHEGKNTDTETARSCSSTPPS